MTASLRQPQHRYQDPLTRIWLYCAERVGFRIERSSEVYASSDGRGTIFIGRDEILDPDDSLAQMIFHELCHALVQGETNEGLVDWGLDNTRPGNPWREYACLRLQAYLADSVGLRDFFAPTTDYRVSFWEALPADPFVSAEGRREPSCVAARLAAWRATLPRWAAPLQEALKASAAIAAHTPKTTVGDVMPSLWMTVAAAPSLHMAGHAAIAVYYSGHACADCAWFFLERQQKRCQYAPAVRLVDGAPACVRWEPATELDCVTCGACCREAYHAVEISRREPLIKRHPNLVVTDGTRQKLRRESDRCAALAGGGSPSAAFACAIYTERPKTCREFTRGSANCLDARRRVGLSL